MDRAGTDDDEQAIVDAHDDLGSVETPLDDRLDGIVGEGDFRSKQGRGDKGILSSDWFSRN